MILVDTNVLLDLVTDDPDWSEWSLARLEEAALAGPILINDIVYAETSIRYDRIEDLDAMLAQAMIEIAATPRSALFLAGKAFQRYRTASGTQTGVLPDFFIGAHAAVEGWPLLTRDAGRYRSYFPKVSRARLTSGAGYEKSWRTTPACGISEIDRAAIGSAFPSS